jgi:hypothetical protein
MTLRLLAYLALGIDASARREWLLALLCFTTPFIGKYGMGTAFVAGMAFIAMGQFAEGAIAIAVVVFNLIGNQVIEAYDLGRSRVVDEWRSDNPARGGTRWPFRKAIEKRLIRSFETGLRLIQVSLYTRLQSQYSAAMPKESAKVLAAQVVNYLKGEDIIAVMDNSSEPLKTQIARIKD